MRFTLKIILTTCLLMVSTAQASNKSCNDMKSLMDVAEKTIQAAMDADVNDEVSDYLVLSGDDPEIKEKNVNGKDTWSVPVVVDGEGCYGDVSITVKTGTCKVDGEPSFSGVSCTDD